jgi:hypothetical protein
MNQGPTTRHRSFRHHGVQVHEFDFSHSSAEEATAVLEAYEDVLKSAGPKSVAFLLNATHTYYSPRNANRMKAALPLAEKAVIRSAIFGLSPFMRVAINGYFAVGRFFGQAIEERIRICASRDEALNWLASEKLNLV